jgi:hypothetical protein
MESPPHRPRTLAPAELGFVPRDAVRWFSPQVLAVTALHVGITSVFGSFLDKRELQSPEPCTPDRRYREAGEMWFDYVADTGDGFAATATVAHALGRPSLTVPGAGELPRGRLIVFGGDEVYPMPESKGYDDRMTGPWTAALPWTDGEHPAAYAIPGNHDWMDGLTGFLRLFAQGGWIGGWKTQQTRSYFAVALPHDWWLWGIDIQSEALIDRPQLDFFAGVAEEATAKAAPARPRLVLATATPAWTELPRNPRAYANLAYLERTVLEPAGVTLALIVSGDRHYYARYQGPEGAGNGVPRHLVTAGGGGAFLHPTHELPSTTDVPASTGGEPGGPPPTTYVRAASYPSRGRSRALSLQALALPARNLSFVPAAGAVCVALLWAVQFGLRSLQGRGGTFAAAAAHWGWSDLASGLFRSFPSLLVLLVLLAALVGFARPPDRAGRGLRKVAAKVVMGAAHMALQVVALATVLMLALDWASAFHGVAFAVVASLTAFALGGVVSALVVGLYLLVAVNLPGGIAHANEAFAAARITRAKNFLRFHIGPAGDLTVYAIGIDRVVERGDWRPDPGADGNEAPWLVPPDGEPRLHLIERIELP